MIVKPKYGENAKLCYMDSDSFIVHVKTRYFIDIAEDVEIRFDTSNFELDHSLQKRMVRKHYYNSRYLTNMLKIRSRGKGRAQYFNVKSNLVNKQPIVLLK